ncbi:MAG TPA: hypothetical protein VF816_03400 [Rhodocyclaceae bacterium]
MMGRPAAALAGAALIAATGAAAEEIAPYRLTGVDGYASLEYASDEQRVDQPGASRSRQAQSGWRSELFAMTHSYVYHPNLMTLDLGGGPILHGESFVGDSGTAQARGLLYNFTARANLLRDKPYSGDLFFSHLNPTVSVGPGQVLTQENVRYGFDFSLRAPVISVPLQLGFLHSQTQARGADRSVDDRTDQVNFTATRSYDAAGSTQLRYQSSRQASRSGSLDLPLQTSDSSSQGLSVDTRLQLGDNRQYDLTNLFSVDSQRYSMQNGSIPALSNLRFMLDGRARQSDALQSFATYSYGHSRQGVLDVVSQAGSTGIAYWLGKQLQASAGLRADDNRTQGQFRTQSQGVDGSLRYEAPLAVGTGQASYGVRLDRHDQVAAMPRSSVIGEFQTLAGTAYVALAHPYVVAGSINVYNASRSQLFVEGADYTLLVVGTETRVQRLIGGRILDGEQVLVDYAYDTGGSYSYRQLDQTVNLGWNLSRFVSAYYRRLESTPRLTSGLPAFPLNEMRSNVFGLRADMPWNSGIATTLGGALEREERRETISPFRRYSAEAYAQSDEPLLDLGFFRLSGRRVRVDYDIPLQNSNLRAGELRYWSRQRFGIDVNAALAAERDDAGVLPRQRRDFSLGARWQQRRLTVSATLQRTWESQGGIDRNRTAVQFLARRELW